MPVGGRVHVVETRSILPWNLVSGRGSQQSRNLLLQDRDQVWIHVLEVVGDAQADDPFVAQRSGELLLELLEVPLLHDEDDIGPIESLGIQRGFGIGGQARGSGLPPVMVRKDSLRGGASEAVAAADEEEAHRSESSDRGESARTSAGGLRASGSGIPRR